MDEDEEIQEVSSRTSKPMSVVHVKEEIPFTPRIKNEKEEEERKSRRKESDRRQEGTERRHQDESVKRYQEELDNRRREAVIKRRREEKEERERESRKKIIEARRREDTFKTKSKPAEEVSGAEEATFHLYLDILTTFFPLFPGPTKSNWVSKNCCCQN